MNGAGSEPFDHIGGTVAYIVGLMLPFVVVAAADTAFPPIAARLHDRRVVAAGAVVLVVYGVLFATTLFDDISSELARRSTF